MINGSGGMNSLNGSKIFIDVLRAKGHQNIRATHPSTLEITTEKHLTPRGDCIIGVSADKPANKLSPQLKNALKRDKSVLIIVFLSGKHWDYIIAKGSKNLMLTSDKKIIIRKSNYVEPSTIGILANKSARDLDRGLINNLRKGAELIVVFIVFTIF